MGKSGLSKFLNVKSAKWVLNFILLIFLSTIHLIVICSIWLVIIFIEIIKHSWNYRKQSLYYDNVLILRTAINQKLDRVTLARSQRMVSKVFQRLQ